MIYCLMTDCWWCSCFFPTAPSMMSLRQRHIDPQLAMGSQRLVESCLLAGQQGEGSPYPSRSRSTFRQSRSQSFGHIECLPLAPLSSAVSHPSIICTTNLNSSSCLPSYVGSSVTHHSSHIYQKSFQPMDPIPDFTSDVSKSCSDSFGYPSLSNHTHCTCVWVICFFTTCLSHM